MASVQPYNELSDEAQAPTAVTQSLKFAEQQVRQGFIRKVYGILAAQMVVTIAVAAPITHLGPRWVSANPWLVWGSMVGSMAMVCSLICCRDAVKTFPKNYILLFFFTVFEGCLVGAIASMYTAQSVLLAMGMTLAIFIGMTFLACTTKIDFTGYAPYLAGFLMTMVVTGGSLCMLQLAGIHSTALQMGYNFLCVLLFTMYLVWDTQMIVGGNHQIKFDVDDYVMAALQIYMDIINLFINLLQLFGDRN